MPVSEITAFVLEDEAAADEYLKAVLSDERFRSMDEIEMRADKYASNPGVRDYMLARAREILGC